MSDVDIDERLQVLLDDFMAASAPDPDVAAIVAAGRRRARWRRIELGATALAMAVVVLVVAGAVLRAPALAPAPPATSADDRYSPLVSSMASPVSPVKTSGTGAMAVTTVASLSTTAFKSCAVDSRDSGEPTNCTGAGTPGTVGWRSLVTEDPEVVLIHGVVSSPDTALVTAGNGAAARVATIVRAEAMSDGVAFYALVPRGDPGIEQDGDGDYVKAYDSSGKRIVPVVASSPTTQESLLSPKVSDRTLDGSTVNGLVRDRDGKINEQLSFVDGKICPTGQADPGECLDLDDTRNQAAGSVGMRGTPLPSAGAYLVYGVYRGVNVHSIVVGTGETPGSPLRFAEIGRVAGVDDRVVYWAIVAANDPIATDPTAPRPQVRVYDKWNDVIASV